MEQTVWIMPFAGHYFVLLHVEPLLAGKVPVKIDYMLEKLKEI